MAQKVQVELIDDLDGSPAAETVRFSLDGKQYEIDLSATNATELREGLADYVSAGRKAGSGPRRPRKTEGASTHEMRTWALEHGYEPAPRGRVSNQIAEAYRAAKAS